MRKAVGNPKVLITSACVALLASGLWAILWSKTQVLVLDSRFHVLTVNWSSGTNHVLFEGNQLEGRLRDWLLRIGLRVKGIPVCHFRTDRNAQGLLVCYKGDFSPGELNDVTAELTGPRNQMIPLRTITQSEDRTKKEFVGVWVLDSPMKTGSEFRIKLRTASVDLAEIIGDKL